MSVRVVVVVGNAVVVVDIAIYLDLNLFKCFGSYFALLYRCIWVLLMFYNLFGMPLFGIYISLSSLYFAGKPV